MGSGYIFIYSSPNYMITDEQDYFAVHDRRACKQIAAFKEEQAALDYVLKFLRDTF